MAPGRWEVEDVARPLCDREFPDVRLIGGRSESPHLSRVRQVRACGKCREPIDDTLDVSMRFGIPPPARLVEQHTRHDTATP